MSMTAITDLPPTEMRERLAAMGQPTWRAGQVLRWLYRRGAESFDQMTDLPRALRHTLAEAFTLIASRVVETRRADDGTMKLLIELADGRHVETVVIPEGRRRTLCLSTSVGCAFGCAFCASGLGGLDRFLTAGEMVEQVLHGRIAASESQGRPASAPSGSAIRNPRSAITNVVVMGIGEPLANGEALARFLRIANDPAALGLGARRITVSTVGLPEGIRALADLGLQVNLAVSLHAPDDDLRSNLVPANRGIGIEAILEASADYFRRTGRRVTYEYCLLAGVNDSAEQARRLAKALRRAPGLVNVMAYNTVAGLPFRPPTGERVDRFVALLREAGMQVQVRRRRGGGIEAACGQLRADRLARSGKAGTG